MKAKPVEFKFSEYISEAYQLYKNNLGQVLLAVFFMVLMCFIPFCGYMAQGNFYRFMQKLKSQQNPDAASELFNFQDFKPYFILFVILFAGILFLESPLFFLTFTMEDNPRELPVYFPFYIIALIAIVFYFVARAFYMPGLISLKGVKDLKQAWAMSSEMSKGNLLIIIAFMFVVGICAQLGVLACGVGVLLTIPFQYVAYFCAIDDGLKQQSI